MKKILSLAVVLSVLLAAGCAKKNAGPVKAVDVERVMESVLAEFKGLNSSFAAKDYAACRKNFAAISGLFASLKSVQPSTGTKLTWDTIHGSIIAACKTGITGCATRNELLVGKSIETISAAMMSGHKVFR